MALVYQCKSQGVYTEPSGSEPTLSDSPDLHLRLVVPFHHLRGEVLQTQGRLQGGTHGVQVRTQGRRLKQMMKKIHNTVQVNCGQPPASQGVKANAL